MKDQDDPKHKLASKILNQLISLEYFPIITSSLVVTETYTLMMYRSKRNLNQLQFLDNLFWGEERFFKIVYFDKPDFQNIAQTMKKYSSPKKMLSFVDASLIYLSNQLKISQIVSFDVHFDGILNRIFEISL